jgi:hypothetical protein
MARTCISTKLGDRIAFLDWELRRGEEEIQTCSPEFLILDNSRARTSLFGEILDTAREEG